MTKRSKQIALDEARPGMVLAEDLLTPRGKVILPAGAALTEAIVQSLHRYDIETLAVAMSGEMAAAEEAAELARHMERIARLFRKNQADKASAQLQQCVTLFRTRGGA